MAQNKFVSTVEIKAAVTGLNEIQQEIKKELGNLKFDFEKNKSFGKLFENFETEYKNFLNLTKNNEVDLIDVKGVQNSAQKLKKIFSSISSEVSEFGKLDLGLAKKIFPSSFVSDTSAALKVLSNYEKSLEKLAGLQGDLSNLRSEKAKLDKELKKELQIASVKDASDKFKEMTNSVTKLKGEIENLEKKKITISTDYAQKAEEARTEAGGKTAKELKRRKFTLEGNLKKEGISTEQQKSIKAEIDNIDKLIKKYSELEKEKKKALDEVESELKKKNAEKTNTEGTLSKANKTQADLVNIKGVIDLLNQSIKDLGNSESLLSGLVDEFSKLGISLEGIDTSDIEQIRNYIEQIDDNVLKNVAGQMGNLGNKAQEATPQVEAVTNEIQELNKETKNIKEAERNMENLKGSVMQFVGYTGAINLIREAFRSAYDTVKELDSAMKEMAVVTDMDIGDYWEQLPEYTKRAKELGVAIKDVYDAQALFIQQGLEVAEATELADESLKLMKITGQDAGETTKQLTAALRGFKLEVNGINAQNVSDVYAELAAVSATDVGGIATAVSKTASIAQSAGMGLETTSAFLTQIIETTQEAPETAGTALKTIIARFQELKKAPDEIGEIDGEIVDANKIETALRSVGVELRDASGQFRSLDEVFVELSGKWDGLDKNTQRYIATMAAGSRQQSRFIAMMSDYSRTQDLVSAANNSAGAANRQYEKTLDSLASKLAQLDTAWDTFTSGLIDEGMIKTGVTLLTNLLDTYNNLANGWSSMFGDNAATNFLDSFSKITFLVNGFKLAKVAASKFFEWAGNKMEQSGIRFGKGMREGYDETKKHIENKEKTDNTKTNKPAKKTPIFGNFQEYKDLRSDIKKDKKALDELNKTYQKTGQQFAGTSLVISELETKSLQTTKTMSAGFKEVSTSLSVASMGVVALGSTLESLGVEGATETCGKLASALTALAGIIGVVSFITADYSVAMLVAKGAITEETLATSGNTLAKILNAIASKVAKKKEIELAAATKLTTKSMGGYAIAITAVVAALWLFNKAAKALRGETPEEKLKKAESAAESAGNAAEAAAESYKNLSDSLENLDDKYSSLKTITKGTKQWRDAVSDINSEVLGLIEKYPELAKFVSNKDGALTLDREQEINGQTVDSYLQDKEQEKYATAAVNIEKQKAVMQAQEEVAVAALDDKVAGDAYASFKGGMAGTGVGAASILAGVAAGAGTGAALGAAGMGVGAIPGAVIGGIAGLVNGIVQGTKTADAVEADLKVKKKEETDKRAKAIAEGAAYKDTNGNWVVKENEISKYGLEAQEFESFLNSLGEGADDLKEYGEQLVRNKEQLEAYSLAQAQQIAAMVDTSKMTQQDANIINNMANVAFAETVTDRAEENSDTLQKEYEKGSGENEAYAEKTLNELGATNVQEEEDGGTVTFNYEGQEMEFDNYEAALEWAGSKQAAASSAEVLENLPKQLGKANKAIWDKGGKELQAIYTKENPMQSTIKDVETAKKALENDGTVLSMWETLDQATKDQYGTMDKFQEAQLERINQMSEATEDARNRMMDLGMSEINIDELSVDAVTGFSNLLENMTFAGGNSAALKFGKTLTETVLQGTDLTDDQKSKLMSTVSSIDYKDLDAWENLGSTLDEMGIHLPTDDLKALTQAGIKAGGAIKKIDFNTLTEDIRKLSGLGKEFEQGKQTRDVSKDYYEALVKNKDLTNQFVTEDGENYTFVGTMEELRKAIEENTVAILDEAKNRLKYQSDFTQGLSDVDWGSINDSDKLDILKQVIKDSGGTANLSQLGIEGLYSNMNLSTLDSLSESNLDKILAGVSGLYNSRDTIQKQNKANVASAELAIYDQKKEETKYKDRVSAVSDENEGALNLITKANQYNLSQVVIDKYIKALEKGNGEAAKKYAKQLSEEVSRAEMFSSFSTTAEEISGLLDEYETAQTKDRKIELAGRAADALGIEATEENYKQIMANFSAMMSGNNEAVYALFELAKSGLTDAFGKTADMLDDSTNALLNRLKEVGFVMLNDAGQWVSIVNEGLSDALDKSGQLRDDFDQIYDIFYNLAKAENAQQAKRNKLEREFERLLQSNNVSMQDLVQNQFKQIESLTKSAAIAQNEKVSALYNIEEAYAKNGMLRKYTKYDVENNQLTIDWQALNKNKSSFSPDTYAAFQEIVGKIEEFSTTIEEADEATADAVDSIKELEQANRESYMELEQMVKEGLVAERQQEIDVLTSINESILEGNQKMIDSMQEMISESRQIRENTKKEEEISNKEKRLAYLKRDTSGKNDLEIKKLRKEIDESKTSYGDNLIDQSIEKLSKENEKAAEQRQEQIDLMTNQLAFWQETGAIWETVEDVLTDSLNQMKNGVPIGGTDAGKLAKLAEGFGGLSKAEQADFLNNLTALSGEASIYSGIADLGNGKTLQDVIDAADGAIQEAVDGVDGIFNNEDSFGKKNLVDPLANIQELLLDGEGKLPLVARINSISASIASIGKKLDVAIKEENGDMALHSQGKYGWLGDSMKSRAVKVDDETAKQFKGLGGGTFIDEKSGRVFISSTNGVSELQGYNAQNFKDISSWIKGNDLEGYLTDTVNANKLRTAYNRYNAEKNKGSTPNLDSILQLVGLKNAPKEEVVKKESLSFDKGKAQTAFLNKDGAELAAQLQLYMESVAPNQPIDDFARKQFLNTLLNGTAVPIQFGKFITANELDAKNYNTDWMADTTFVVGGQELSPVFTDGSPVGMTKWEFLNTDWRLSNGNVLLGNMPEGDMHKGTTGTIKIDLPEGLSHSGSQLGNWLIKQFGQKFKTGGLADFTGPAWLDGTKSHPELVLNAKDTENFIMLKDILSEVLGNGTLGKSTDASKGGDNYFDIKIEVDSLSDDYDVEQLADKIKTMIYDDSVYRNVNSINMLR